MPTKRLPKTASIDHLKHQAKDLLSDFRGGKISAYQRFREFHPACSGLSDGTLADQTLALSDALLATAREYGYASWPRLKNVVLQAQGVPFQLIHNERIEDAEFLQALDFLDEGNEALLKRHLERHPTLVHQQVHFEGDNYFTSPTLLEFVAENPVRQDSLPDNIVLIARMILEAGAKQNQSAVDSTLSLVASGRVAREQGVQEALIDLLCEHGADPASAMLAALGHGELEAAHRLVARGAPMDLPTAAALGKTADLHDLLAKASQEQLQLALSLAALLGRSEAIPILLAAGANPNQYNPQGAHSHCTPLHSAALAGHLDVVQALMDGGAQTTIPDIHHGATAESWAHHAGHQAIVDLLQAGS